MDMDKLLAEGWKPMDVEWVAVLLSPDDMTAFAFDPEGGRPYPAAKAFHEGSVVSEAEFRKLAAEV
jgi:hypothetical protein